MKHLVLAGVAAMAFLISGLAVAANDPAGDGANSGCTIQKKQHGMMESVVIPEGKHKVDASGHRWLCKNGKLVNADNQKR